jgi:hypothetical protein
VLAEDSATLAASASTLTLAGIFRRSAFGQTESSFLVA